MKHTHTNPCVCSTMNIRECVLDTDTQQHAMPCIGSVLNVNCDDVLFSCRNNCIAVVSHKCETSIYVLHTPKMCVRLIRVLLSMLEMRHLFLAFVKCRTMPSHIGAPQIHTFFYYMKHKKLNLFETARKLCL